MHIMKDGPSSANAPGFATLLKHYRRAAGLTQAELAERAGLSTKAISSLERGVNRFPRRETLHLLILALRLDEEHRRVLEASRSTSTSDAMTDAGLHAYVVESADDALGNHIAYLRNSEHHEALVDALLVRAMIAIRTHRWRAAMEDLDEAIALARALSYPVAELKALAIYGQLYSAMGTSALGALVGDSLIALAGYSSLFLVAACYAASIMLA
jgi:transcriptional regulator with XRE-family HTH domain